MDLCRPEPKRVILNEVKDPNPPAPERTPAPKGPNPLAPAQTEAPWPPNPPPNYRNRHTATLPKDPAPWYTGGMITNQSLPPLVPGRRVRVTQSIVTREGPWTTQVEGTVVSCQPRPTGSWFAHGKNDRLWLQRLRLKMDDGELIDLTLDALSEITLLEPAAT